MDLHDTIINLRHDYDEPMAEFLTETAARLARLMVVNYQHLRGAGGCSEWAALDEAERQAGLMLARVLFEASELFGDAVTRL